MELAQLDKFAGQELIENEQAVFQVYLVVQLSFQFPIVGK